MNKQEKKLNLSQVLGERGIVIPNDWAGVDCILPVIDKIRNEGGVVIIKFDGERVGPDDTGQYTVIVMGGKSEGYYCRIDSCSIEEALSTTLLDYFS